MKNYILYFFIPFFLTNSFDAKVLLITHNYNSPEFIELQYKTFKKFIEDDYEYVVFNDANNEGMAKQIKAMCDKHAITCVRVPQEIHTRPYLPRQPGDPLQRPNIRHANCVQYSFDILGFNFDGIVIVIDCDMLLIRSLNFEEYMSDKNIAAYIKGADNNVSYLCPVLSIFKMNSLPEPYSLNFNCGVTDGASVDSGGWTHFYLKKYRNQLHIVDVNYLPSYDLWLGNHDINRPVDHSVSEIIKITHYKELGFNNKEIKFLLQKPDTFELFLDKKFIHYHGITNYTHQSAEYHNRKLLLFKNFVDDLLRD